MRDHCEVRRCRAEAAITYLDLGVCDKHWNQLTAEDAPPDALRISLGIRAAAPTATEERAMEPSTEKTTKKSKKVPAKPKAAKAPKTDLCVFAFRLPIADRDLIHKAADTKQVSATKFVVDTILGASRKALDHS